MDNNYELFRNFNFKKHGFDFYEEFSLYNKNEAILHYLFLPLEEDDYQKYLQELNFFELIRNDQFKLTVKELGEIIQKDGLDIFLTICINKILSNLPMKDYISKNEEYHNFSEFATKKIINNLNFTEDFNNLLFLFYDEKQYKERIRPKITIKNDLINCRLFEILLYGFRYCVNTLDNYKNNVNEKFLFKSLLSKDYPDILINSLIPGIDDKEDLHLITLNDIIDHFNKFEDDCGCYVCNSGYYFILHNSLLTRDNIINCPYCKLKLVFGDKELYNKNIINEDMYIFHKHFRIFKDINQKNSELSKCNDLKKSFHNLTLSEYIKNIIEPIKSACSYGFQVTSKYYFENNYKKVRSLSQIGYRLLNFISYCHLFFNYCMGNILENDLKQYLIENLDILKIIESDWNLLEEALHHNNIGSIQIFMNMISKKLSLLIKECKYLKTNIEREQFEENVEKLILQSIKDYPSYSLKYLKENIIQNNIDNDNLRNFINELIPINEKKYPEKEYPMLKYFLLTKYKTREDLIKNLGQKKESLIKYPLLTQLLYEPEIYKMKYLQNFNEFTNYMIDHYSYKISRKEAKKKILEKENIYKDLEFKNKYLNFLKAWDEIKNDVRKYKYHPNMPIKSLKSSDKLIYFLNDNKDLGYGMHLAAAYQKFIKWQNSLLDAIINCNNYNALFNFSVNNIKNKILIQECNISQIILIEERFKQSKYKNLNDLIYSFSQRNIFNVNDEINYYNYNSFQYDYESIEEELTKIILPGVCQFENEDKLKFVSFLNEGFKEDYIHLFNSLNSKYTQIDLNDNEKKIIIRYIRNVNISCFEYLSTLKEIMLYLIENDGHDNLINIIQNAPIIISNNCKNFFSNIREILTIDKLVNIFCLIEYLNFEYIEKILHEDFKKDIPDNKKNIILNKLCNNKKRRFKIFDIKDLASAVRKYISRYLIYNMESPDDIKYIDLTSEICREDLWKPNIGKLENLMEIIGREINEYNLKVGEAYSFYKLIEEDMELIKYYIY